MRIPRYWAEARRQLRKSGRQVTVRRFGWSDESEQDAQRHAEERAAEAVQQAWTDRRVARSEPKVPYNGAEGVPIREEIVAEHGSTIITRNSYGALCLNTPDVLFADIDYPEQSLSGEAGVMAVVAATLAAVACVQSGLSGSALFAIPITVAAAVWLLANAFRLSRKLQGGAEAIALRSIDSFVDRRQDWQLRVYRTPAGLRVLAMHDVFDPTGPEAQELFTALRCDRVYVAMCRRQACFRARVSPKPWRIGLDQHLKPQPGVWPVTEYDLPRRQAWVAEYEAASRGYAACEYLTTAGLGSTNTHARNVQELHDHLCRATSGLPIA